MKKPALKRTERTVVIKEYRKRIADLKEVEDRLFGHACDKLEIDKDSDRGTTLFDFLFNGGFGGVKTPAQLEKVLWPSTK